MQIIDSAEYLELETRNLELETWNSKLITVN